MIDSLNHLPRPDAGADTLAERFADLAPPLNARQAALESARCLYCYDAPCVNACPTEIDIPGFIRSIARTRRRRSSRRTSSAAAAPASAPRKSSASGPAYATTPRNAHRC